MAVQIDQFRVTVAPDPETMSRRAAELIVGELRARPDLLVCAATGSTPTRAYELLARYFASTPALFEKLRVFKLDEWGGLPADDPGSCESYLRRYLIGPLRISDDRYLTFRGDAADAEAECAAAAAALRRNGPIDLCILGLGLNGHLGFNEPADALHPHAHVARLSPESLAHPMVRQIRTPLRYGLTLGMADVLQSKKVLLLVNGLHKRETLRRLLTDRTVSTRFPASFLRLHPDVTCCCDAAAAGA